MAKIKSEAAYDAALKRIEYLEDFVDDDTAPNDPNALELDMLIDLVEEYEAVHYPIGKTEPSLSLTRNICKKLNISPEVALGM